MLHVLYAPHYQQYDFGDGHPFIPARQAMLTDLIEMLGMDVAWHAPPFALRSDVLSVHTPAYVEAVERASAGARDLPWAYGLGTTDVPYFDGMDAAARGLVGGTLHGARLVVAPPTRRVLQLGGGLHHAHAGHASGFCIYNDPAVAIRHLAAQGLRVAYVDVDAHHGDGVQSIFYDTPDVLTISFHQSGRTLYPGTGEVDELGEGAGQGYALNVPLLPGVGDDAYLDAFETVVPHALAWFRPDVLVVEAGADAHHLDPLAGLELTTHGFEQLFRRLVALGEKHAGGRMLFTLGGGYHPDSTARVWALLTAVLAGAPLPDTLPEAWRDRWQAELHVPLSPHLHDAAPSQTEARVAAAARATARLLVERVAGLWM